MFYQHIMSSHFSTHYHFPSLFSSSNHLTFPPPPSPSFFLHSFSSSSSKSSIGALSSETKHKKDFRCRAISKSRTREYPDLLESGLATLKLHEIDVEDEKDEEQELNEVWNEIKKRVEAIKTIFGSMEDGEITVSAYDTAWVALVEDVNGSGAPQFPSALEWIAKNQIPDGSWGDSEIFIAHDRILNTLACVVALRSWNLHPEKCEKGMNFFKENLSKIQNENAEHMPVGFEVAFPSLLDIARSLNIEVPNDSPILNDILEKRNVKLARIPREMMHKVPTTLLHSLEGMSNLDWKQLQKLQCEDGSFLFSPSSTAFALINTKDEKCLKYLNKAVNKFNGGVPNVYPVDLFEHIWVVDRLDRLGISRYFQQEIKDCMNYVYRYWSEKGICWARNTNVEDIDDTAMGFRLLRLHGHQVSANVFKQFERNGEFFCFGGQSTQAVTGMYNVYRASQVMFPGEEILEHAKQFSAMFLREKQAANELLDKWIIMKNLPQEVAYALDVPWYANLPRVETRFYIDQYGGENDVWIGKTLYRMPYVNNKNYLELAKLDYNNCQALHLTEWARIQEWYSESRLGEFGLSRKRLLLAYFLAAANIFEPERSHERLAWAKTTALLETITIYLSDAEMRKAFVINFIHLINVQQHSTTWMNKTGHALAETLVSTIDQISLDIFVSHGLEIRYDMHHTWKKWLSSWQSEVDKCEGEAELLVQIINLSGGHWISKEQLFHPQYQRLLQLTNTICHRLHFYHKDKELENARNIYNITTPEVESDMQELVQLVFQKSLAGIDFNIKKTFLMVAKNFYYAAFFDSRTIGFHIAKVLFDKVV
ncbi:PREDICTED: ent-copalyl diphosphate synthase, chloroplastic-like isoform X2 [Lupinus angustifolius]|uniref:ent-copalyl diphosphate synthase, chloroplastic-like isoform X2 n=1 Tax=Lupinus angustifolius TaxID=3871 RepID=UPI00092E8620|nr:PREDICTED: ent-copalyl diphosphate synthase, chloroplastic-like isoform X2 [Lupinus angustifolius]